MKRLLIPLMFMSSFAFAAPSVNDVETLIAQKQYTEAEMALENVVKEYPNSLKAHYYLHQIYQRSGDKQLAQQELQTFYKLQDGRDVKKSTVTQAVGKAGNEVGNAVMWLIIFSVLAVAVVLLGRVGLDYWDDIKDSKERAAKRIKRSDDLLKRSLQVKSKARSLLTELKVNGYQNAKEYEKTQEFSDLATDAIECLTKGADCNLNYIEEMIDDFDRFCIKVQKQML